MQVRALIVTAAALAALTVTTPTPAMASFSEREARPGIYAISAVSPPAPHPTASPPPMPAANCHTRWCEQVRRVRRLERRLSRYLESVRSPIPAWAVVRAGRDSGISPFALAGIAVAESSAGLAACGRNSTGLGACGRAWTAITLCGKRWTLAGIDSWYAGLRMTGELIRCLWPQARTVHDLHGYCAGCPYWAGQVAAVMARMGSGPGVRYRDALEAVR